MKSRRSLTALSPGLLLSVMLVSCGGGGYMPQTAKPTAAPLHLAASTPVTVDGQPGTITEFTTPQEPNAIAMAPDGNPWFQTVPSINKIAPDGAVSSFSTSGIQFYNYYQQIALGPDNAMWFTAAVSYPNCSALCITIRKVTLNGTFTTLIPSVGIETLNNTQSTQNDVALGPNHEMWFAVCDHVNPGTNDCAQSRLLSLRMDGTIDIDRLFPTGGPNNVGYIAHSMVLGRDGYMYATAFLGTGCASYACDSNTVLRLNGRGDLIGKLDVPHAYWITNGPDGNLWVTNARSSVLRVTLSGSVTEFTVPTANAGTLGITAGNDGAIWFTEYNGSKIGRITMSGKVTEFDTPRPNSHPFNMVSLAGECVTGHGRIWFTEQYHFAASGALESRVAKIEF